MSDRFTYAFRKPYQFVPLQQERPERQRPVGHDRLLADRFTGFLQIRIKTLAPLHVRAGDGEWVSLPGTQAPVGAFFRSGGHLTIPGSSLRGVVRSVAEAVSRSCGPALPRDFERVDSVTGPCHNAALLCPTCRLFGFVNGKEHYRGHVQFSDLRLLSGATGAQLIPRLEAPFKDYELDRKIHGENYGGNERLYYCALHQVPGTGCKPEDCPVCTKANHYEKRRLAVGTLQPPQQRPIRWHGRKFYPHGDRVRPPSPDLYTHERRGVLVEAVQPGAVFAGEVRFENCSLAEIQLLGFSLGLGETLQLKLGYGKPVFLGSVQVSLESVKLRTGQSGRPDDLTGWLQSLARDYRSPGADVLRRLLAWERRWDGIEPPDAPKNVTVNNRDIY